MQRSQCLQLPAVVVRIVMNLPKSTTDRLAARAMTSASLMLAPPGTVHLPNGTQSVPALSLLSAPSAGRLYGKADNRHARNSRFRGTEYILGKTFKSSSLSYMVGLPHPFSGIPEHSHPWRIFTPSGVPRVLHCAKPALGVRPKILKRPSAWSGRRCRRASRWG
jgi:hypothetical protein